MSSTSAGATPGAATSAVASEAQQQQLQQQQQQPSTSAASLNVQVGNNQGGPGAAMMSPHHPGPSSQADNRYAYHPYGGKPMSQAIHQQQQQQQQQRAMAPQQWLPPHGPDGPTSDAMALSQQQQQQQQQLQQSLSNYPGQGYPPQMNIYGGNPQMPPTSGGNNGYWMQPPQQQQQQQQPRYPMQQYPGYGPPIHQGYGYPPMQQHGLPPPPGDWGRMPQMHYPTSQQQQQQQQQPMQQPPISGPPQTLPPPPPTQQQPPQQQLPPPPPPQGAPTPSQPSSSSTTTTNIAAVAQALQSPGAGSIGGHDEGGDDTKSIRSTSSVPPPHTPARTPAATPSASSGTPGTSTAKTSSTPASSAKHAPPPSREEVLEKLCYTTDQIGPELTMQRRAFFDTILLMFEKDGEAVTGAPQVSKSPIDLHKLYIKVKEKGGFEQVTKDKVWKDLCIHANPDMSASSAAGYQLRRHYVKYLLKLECAETGKNPEELIAVADKQKKKKKEKDPAGAGAGGTPKQEKHNEKVAAAAAAAAAAEAAAVAVAPPPQQPPSQMPQQPQPQQLPPPPHQTLQPPPPQGYSQQQPQHPHGVPPLLPPPPPGQPGPSYVVDANGQPIQGYGQPGPYGYGVVPWGAPPPGYPPHYPPQQQQQPPRYPSHMMLPPGVQGQQQQQQMQMPPPPQPQQQHGMPPPLPPGGPQQQPGMPSSQPQQQPQQQQQPSSAQPQQPGRPPMDQTSFEEHQRQMIQQQQQQRPKSRAKSKAPTPQPPPPPPPPSQTSQCSTAPGTSEQQQQPPQSSKPQTPAAQPPPPPTSGAASAAATPTPVATSQASSVSQGSGTPQPPPPATTSAGPNNLPPQTSIASSSSESGNSSALSNQLGQPPPMGMYGPPPQHMQMYPRMPYPTHQGMPNGYPQQLPGGDGLQQQQPQPGMYPPHPSQQQMYGQQQQQLPQGWNPQMMRPPMPSQPPPQGYPGQPPQQQPGQGPLPPQQQQQQPGQSSHEFWQHQQRAAMAAAAAAQQQQQQQQSQGQKKPPYFPSNQPPPQASPQPSQRGQQGHQTPNNSSSTIPPPPPQQQTPIQQPKMLPPQQPQPGPSHQQQQQQTPQLPPSQHHHRQMGMQQPGPSQQQLQPQHAFLQQHLPPPPIVFPPNCVEAIALQHLGPQKRPAKKLSKDLISATSRRIYMALKSNIHMEIIWALNSLTVMLYDDTITPPTLSTEILNIIIEHFRASLSLVFPKAFPLEDPAAMDTSESTKIETKTFWEQIIFDAEKSGETIKTKVKLPTAMKNSLGKDLNSISRGGIKIISKDSEMPPKLKEWKETSWKTTSSSENDKTADKKKVEMSYAERRQLGLPTEFSLKVAESTKEFVEQTSVKSEKIKFSKWETSGINKHVEYDDDVQPKELSKNIENDMDLNDEYYDHEAPLDCTLVPRPIGMFLIPDSIQTYSQLCLSWSNVIRGFSFNPVNELHLVNHHGLLRLIGRLLMLYVENGDGIKQLSRKRKHEIEEKNPSESEFEKYTTPEEDAATKIEDEKKRAAIVSTEKDDMRSYLLDIANQLRDDAFTILSFMAGSIDLFDLDSEISYPIFDALIHWTVSHSVLSKDPLVTWGIICPRDFCLEIIAKMSVIDHNVDLLLSTGSWKRIEEFVRIVSDLLHMGEDTPIREFALVIMSALCQASESVCVIAALETNIVKNVISFMEAVDSKMHEVVSTKGINELRNNPECIGTSIGMLRRAGYLLGFIVQYETCRKPFLKYMNNLINLTISHYMDTRVAIQIASIVHTAQLSNIDAISGKCLDVPDTPSVEPEILFPNKLPKFPPKKEDSDSSSDKEVGKKEAENGNNEKNGNNKLVVPKMNGIKRAFEETAIPSTSTVSLASSISTNCEMIIENGISQLNGIHDGIIQNGNSTKLPRVNGIHKSSKESTTASQQTVSPKQDVKAILRNSINHKQEVSSSTTTITAVATTVSGPTPSKRTRLDVNGSSSTNTSNPTNGRINGTSPSSSVSSSVAAAATNGPTTTTTSSSSSSMAIVT